METVSPILKHFFLLRLQRFIAFLITSTIPPVIDFKLQEKKLNLNYLKTDKTIFLYQHFSVTLRSLIIQEDSQLKSHLLSEETVSTTSILKTFCIYLK